MMNHHSSPVVVRKFGFFPSLFLCVFGTLATVIVCGSGVAIYAMRILDHKSDGVLALTTNMFDGLPRLRDSLPPAVADMLNDRRDPAYRENLDVDVRVVAGHRDERQRAVVTVKNEGSETVSLLALRVVLGDEESNPVDEIMTYAATPVTIENDWRGPLLPGSTRTYYVRTWRRSTEPLTARVEVTDVRVWTPASAPAPTAIETQVSAVN